MDEKNQSMINGKFLFRLTVDIVSLVGVFSIFLFFIYVVGNFQGFQDTTQSIILETLSISSIFFGLISLVGIVESIYFFIVRDVLKIWQNIIFLILMIICVAISVSFLSSSILLNVLSGGL